MVLINRAQEMVAFEETADVDGVSSGEFHSQLMKHVKLIANRLMKEPKNQNGRVRVGGFEAATGRRRCIDGFRYDRVSPLKLRRRHRHFCLYCVEECLCFCLSSFVFVSTLSRKEGGEKKMDVVLFLFCCYITYSICFC